MCSIKTYTEKPQFLLTRTLLKTAWYGPERIVLILLLFAAAKQAAAQENIDNWFAFKPTENSVSSSINTKHWLHAPAGKYGAVKMSGDDLFFDNGQQVKFWGVNIASNKPFVSNDSADRWVKFITAYGINAVRFHKFTWDATDGIQSTQLSAEKWKRFDYFSNALKSNGVYIGWSHIYGHRVLPADSSRMLAYKEVAATKFPWSHLNGSTAAIVNFAEDLQALNIELTVNMLNHRNPNSGLRYADDAALAFIELQNEDNIFWGAIEETLKQTPTYRALLCKKFSRWLKARYKSQEALLNAWGSNTLPPHQTLEQENIYPNPNHGYFSHQSSLAWSMGGTLPQDVADKALFLYEEQIAFYNRFVKAIRETGYKGLIIGSCWQAGSGIAHLWNIYADAQTGVVDRHNYSGGGTGHVLKPGAVKNDAMVTTPGSGLLSTGFQQVENVPFFISEWMSLIPNEWTAESAPIIAAYGLGLQGWDASFAFAMDYDRFTPTIQSGHGVYNVTAPTQLALYPALSAMIYRGDVGKGKIVANRNADVALLKKGKLPFLEKVEQESDVKKLQASVPLSALAVGRVTLSFDRKKNVAPSYQRFIDSNLVSSETGQLKWHTKGKGFFTINTKGTQGVVGFASGQEIRLDDLTLKTSNDFAIVLVSSLTKKENISGAKSVLVTCIARARNSGMRYNSDHTQLEEVGRPPVLLEPVNLEIQFNKQSAFLVHVLDHSGNRTGKTIAARNGKIVLNSEEWKTIYYEIEAK